MGEWQPIETAPKDGTPVLIYGGQWGQEYRDDLRAHDLVSIAEWCEGAVRFATVHLGFWTIEDSDGVVAVIGPTHWMPVPEPPQ